MIIVFIELSLGVNSFRYYIILLRCIIVFY